MLTHGVGGLSPLHHWRFGLLSRHTHPHSGRAAFFPHSCYSRAVKGSACSVANPYERCQVSFGRFTNRLHKIVFGMLAGFFDCTLTRRESEAMGCGRESLPGV
jgi:hypothetical protein